MFWSIVVLCALPWLDSTPIRSNFFKPFMLYSFIFFVLTMLILGWLGQEIVEFPFLQFSSIVAFLYFFYFKTLTFDGII
jgi:ubiquinol-cytochrome c reductase cytochrome b subunit